MFGALRTAALAVGALVIALVLPMATASAATGPEPPRLDRDWQIALLALGFALVAAAFVWLPEAGRIAWRRIRALPRGIQLGLAAVVSGAAIVRLFVVPKLVVTMYMGYMMTERAATLADVPRYGVGAQTLWRTLFILFPRDHVTVIVFHCVLGTLTLVGWAAVLARAGFRPAAVLGAVLLAAFLPQLVWSDASDSLTVPVLFWTVGALLMAQDYLDTKRWLPLAGAVIWLALAAHTRPEHVIFGPALVLAVLAAQDGPARLRDRLRLPWRPALAATLAYAALAAPQVLHAFFQRSRMLALDSWPREFGQILPDLPNLLVTRNALLDPRMVPLALLPLAVLGLVFAAGWATRRLRLTLLLFGLVWLGFYYIDISVASMPRLHVVGTLPVALVAGAFLGDLAGFRRERPSLLRYAGPALAAVGLGLVGAGVPANVAWLWQPTNEREEDSFFRAALSHLPEDEPFVLVRRGWGDADGPEDHHTHLHRPDYLVTPPERPGTVVSISDFLSVGPDQRPTYFYLGMGCFSRFREEGSPPPLTWFSRGCQQMLDGYELEPVVERVIPNHGDVMLHYYSQDPYLLLGLYRVTPRAQRRLTGADEVATTELAIPPGQEALLERMLGDGVPLPGGCRLETATVDRSVVRARYACAEGASVPLELHPAAADVAARQTTAQFAIAAPEGPGAADPETGAAAVRDALVAAVATLVRANEAQFRWTQVNRPPAGALDGVGAEESFAGTLDHAAPAHPQTEAERRMARIEELYELDRNAEAYAMAVELAREDPAHPGVLGMIVSNLASTQPDHDRVAQLAAAADAAPEDTLAQFIAGVAAHYCAHYKARSNEDKKSLYAQALRYLERTRPAYDFEPRVYIYLAVSHFRLGHQDQAEALIEEAVHLDNQDADAYYCRAEIFQRKEPQRSLRDLRRYLASAAQPTGVVKPGKVRRVQTMLTRLVRRMNGEVDDLELWDPLQDQGVATTSAANP